MPTYEYERLCNAIEDAQQGVKKAQLDHSRGGSVDAVNKANRRLVDAQDDLREWTDGRVPTNR